jgi:hypothetical protein
MELTGTARYFQVVDDQKAHTRQLTCAVPGKAKAPLIRLTLHNTPDLPSGGGVHRLNPFMKKAWDEKGRSAVAPIPNVPQLSSVPFSNANRGSQPTHPELAGSTVAPNSRSARKILRLRGETCRNARRGRRVLPVRAMTRRKRESAPKSRTYTDVAGVNRKERLSTESGIVRKPSK